MSFADALEKEQRREINRLQTKIENRYEKPSFDLGFSDPGDMKLGEGWTQYHLFGNEDFDAWMREAAPGASLPNHVYPDNHLYLVLLEGEVRLTADGNTQTLNENDAARHLKPGTSLSVEAAEESRMVALFRPPIAD